MEQMQLFARWKKVFNVIDVIDIDRGTNSLVLSKHTNENHTFFLLLFFLHDSQANKKEFHSESEILIIFFRKCFENTIIVINWKEVCVNAQFLTSKTACTVNWFTHQWTWNDSWMQKSFSMGSLCLKHARLTILSPLNNNLQRAPIKKCLWELVEQIYSTSRNYCENDAAFI